MREANNLVSEIKRMDFKQNIISQTITASTTSNLLNTNKL